MRAEGDSETAHLQLSYASLCHPCCPSSRDLRVAASHPSLKHVDHIYSLGSGHRMPGPRIALRVARRMSCTQCRVIMVICPCFQRRLQMCHGTKTGLLVGWVLSSSVEPVLTYCCTKYTYTHASFYRSAGARQRSATLPASHWTQGRLCSQHTSDPAVILLKGGRVGRGPRRDRIGKQCSC